MIWFGFVKVGPNLRHHLKLPYLFIENPTPLNSIHAKFGYKTGLPVVGDAEWGHLQVLIK